MSREKQSIVIIAIAMVLLFGLDIPSGGYLFVDKVFDFGHLILFGLISIAVLWLVQEKSKQKGYALYVSAGIITISVGILSEIIQVPIPGRFCELGDMVNDVLGTVTFLGMWYCMHEKGISQRAKGIIIAASLLLIGVSFVPSISAGLDDFKEWQSFPTIASFERKAEIKRWKTGHADIERVRAHATDGIYSMKVYLHPDGRYPGVSTSYFPRDWKGYKKFMLDVYLDGGRPLRITIRINDKEHNQEYEDRYNRGFRLKPGQNHIVIDLEDVHNAPATRKMDMENITNICIFSYMLHGHRTFYLDRVTLGFL